MAETGKILTKVGPERKQSGIHTEQCPKLAKNSQNLAPELADLGQLLAKIGQSWPTTVKRRPELSIRPAWIQCRLRHVQRANYTPETFILADPYTPGLVRARPRQHVHLHLWRCAPPNAGRATARKRALIASAPACGPSPRPATAREALEGHPRNLLGSLGVTFRATFRTTFGKLTGTTSQDEHPGARSPAPALRRAAGARPGVRRGASFKTGDLRARGGGLPWSGAPMCARVAPEDPALGMVQGNNSTRGPRYAFFPHARCRHAILNCLLHLQSSAQNCCHKMCGTRTGHCIGSLLDAPTNKVAECNTGPQCGCPLGAPRPRRGRRRRELPPSTWWAGRL